MPEYINSGMQDLIDEYIHSDRDREIMSHKMIDGWSHELLAMEYKLSVRQIGNIIHKYLPILWDHYDPGE